MKSETKLFLGIIVGTIAIVIGGVLLMTHSATTSAEKVDPTILIRGDSDKISTASASVTLVEFGDFQCSACGQYHLVVQKVLSDFQKNITFVFRNFPLEDLHPNALIAAQAAEAAGVQGKYWEMHNMLYDKQNEWVDSKAPTDIFNGYAQTLGLNVDQFKTDINSPDVQKKINVDIADGNVLAINQTPTFYVNGVKVDNPATLADFEALIKANIPSTH